MLEITGNMWQVGSHFDAVCITTNGSVRNGDGRAVMGRGCAAEAAKFWPDVPGVLGGLITDNGNVVQVIREVLLPAGARCTTFSRTVTLVSFPVKPGFILPLNKTGTFDPPDQATMDSNTVAHMHGQFKPGQTIPGWACLASLHLIEESATQLAMLATRKSWKLVLLPRPGCGAGERQWEDVRPILNKILDDRFMIITRKT